MEHQQWKYKLGRNVSGLVVSLILFAIFGGLSVWLYCMNNGAVIFTAIFSALILAIILFSIYRMVSVQFLISEYGFFHQTKLGNGTYYNYNDITEAWASGGRSTSDSINYYLSYKTRDGQVTKFLFWFSEFDAIDYLLTQINGEGIHIEEDLYE